MKSLGKHILRFLLAYLLNAILFIAINSFFSGLPIKRNHEHSFGLGKLEIETNCFGDLFTLFKLTITIASDPSSNSSSANIFSYESVLAIEYFNWTMGTFSNALNISFKSSIGNLWFTSLSKNCFISPLHLSISYGR